MANENLKMGEGFSAKKVPAQGIVEVKTRHRVMGWGTISSVLAAIAYALYLLLSTPGNVMQERPSLNESLEHKITGYLTIKQIRAGEVFRIFGPYRNTIVDAGETALRDCFIATSCTDTQNFKFHGIGTSSAAIAETQTGCQAELTTQYNPNSTRATGTQANNGANVYRTVATNTVDESATIEEFCLMAAATGAATMWSRILTGTITLAANDGLQTTYDLTIE